VDAWRGWEGYGKQSLLCSSIWNTSLSRRLSSKRRLYEHMGRLVVSVRSARMSAELSGGMLSRWAWIRVVLWWVYRVEARPWRGNVVDELFRGCDGWVCWFGGVEGVDDLWCQGVVEAEEPVCGMGVCVGVEWSCVRWAEAWCGRAGLGLLWWRHITVIW
jgi:hypothetical protein